MRLPRWLKYTLAGFAALCAVAAIALVVVVQTIDVDRYARLAIAEVKTATGRELVIRGKLDISLFPRLAVRTEESSFANATWGSRPEMVPFKAKRVDGAVALLPLLRRKVEITRLAVTDLDLLLEKDAKGVGNWLIEKPATGAASQPAGGRVQLRARRRADWLSIAAPSRGGTAHRKSRCGSRSAGCSSGNACSAMNSTWRPTPRFVTSPSR